MIIGIVGLGLIGGSFALAYKEARETVYAFDIQKERFRGTDVRFNSSMTEAMVREFCCLGSKEEAIMARAYSRYSLSPRKYFRVLKLARTIADIKGIKDIDERSVCSALGYTRFLNQDTESM